VLSATYIMKANIRNIVYRSIGSYPVKPSKLRTVLYVKLPEKTVIYIVAVGQKPCIYKCPFWVFLLSFNALIHHKECQEKVMKIADVTTLVDQLFSLF